MTVKRIFLVQKRLSEKQRVISTMSIILMLLLATSILFVPFSEAATDGSGKIVGTVIDEITGEPLLGITIAVEGT